MPQSPVNQRGVRRFAIRLHLDVKFRPTIAEDRPSFSSDLNLATIIEADEVVAVWARKSGPGAGLK